MSHDSSPFDEKHAPVLELALLRILSPFTISDTSLRANLTFAKHVLQSNSENTFYIYSQVENPSYVYLVGSWPTLSKHHTFLASSENKDLLARLKDQIVVEWIFHVDVPLDVIPLEAPVMSIGRYRMAKQEARGYTATFGKVAQYLADYVAPHRWAHGRRIDKELRGDGQRNYIELRDQEVYVLFCGWESVERHLEFPKTEGFQKFSCLSDYLSEADIKHVKRLNL